MTQRKPRSFEPYTMNLVLSASGGFEEPLKKVLRQYFHESACEEMTKLIFEALTRYNIEIKTNPDRKVTKEQKKDRHELIETMKELNQRLHPWHIPLPMYELAKTAYTPHQGGETILSEEIRDLLLRLRRLQQLFESIKIQTPAKTNPGKPERDRLLDSLKNIFDDYAEVRGSLKALRTEQFTGDIRLNFIKDIFEVFNMTDPVPRNT